MVFRILAFLWFVSPVSNVLASNAYYITLSNQVARKQELEIITNNAANTNTIGYEEDAIIFDKFDVMQNKKKNNSFVVSRSMYKSGDMGPLKHTNNPMDIAIAGSDQYFKIQTPKGVRYTLSGNIFRNSQSILVNSDGYPFLTVNNGIIQVPDDAIDLRFTSDGTLYADGIAGDRIGIISIPNKFSLVKEGGSLYRGTEGEVPIDDYTVITGALRISNVNAAKVMSQTIETERSFSTTSSLLRELGDLEKQAVNRQLKQN